MKPLNFWMAWPEIISFFLLVIGFFVALGAGSAVIAYTLIMLAGFAGGRAWFRIKYRFKITWSIILLGFLVGFMLGARYGDRVIFFIFYILGIGISYYIHDKEIIKSVEF